jgi:hypothetical protein
MEFLATHADGIAVMIRFLHVLLLSSSLSSSSSAAATTDLGVHAPRFKGIAYRAVNDNATHNIQLLAWIDATSFVGHWSVHHEGTGVNRTAIKSWVPPKPLAPVIANLINSTSHMPAGMRGIKASMYNNESSALADNILPSDANCSGKWPDVKTFSGVWWEHGAAEVATLHDQVLGAYKAAGGELDYWVVDDEQAGSMHSWWIAKGPGDECGKAKWTAIQNDKRFPQLLKLLQALGFGNPDMSDPHWLHKYMTCCGGNLNLHHYGAWAAACGYMFAHWIDVGQASIVRKHFPNAGFSEYGLSINGGPDYPSPTSSGFLVNASLPPAAITPGPNQVGIPGTMMSPALYMDQGAGLAKILKEKFGTKSYPVSPFNAARQAINAVRSGILGGEAAASDIEMVPYLAYKTYKEQKTNASDDYQEVIMHAAVAGVDRFLMWNTHAVGDDNPVVSRSLDELEEIIAMKQGTGNRTWVHQGLADWAAGYMLSGTQVGTACLWRFTPQVKADATVKSAGGSVVMSGMVNTNTGKAESVMIPTAKVIKPKMLAAPAGLWVLQDSVGGVSEGSPGACPFTVSVA